MSEQVRMPKGDWLSILDTVRQRSGGTESMTSAQVPQAIDAVYSCGYGDGYEDGGKDGYIFGKQEAEDICMGKHFAVSFLGDDTRALAVRIPFRPDVVAVYTSHPWATGYVNTYRAILADLRACGNHMGHVLYCNSSGVNSSNLLTTSSGMTAMTYEDSTFCFELASSSIPTVIWRSNVRYTIMAVKFPEEDVRSLIEEQIRTLPEDEMGEVTYNSERILEIFAEDAWETLIQSKPSWTFTMV